MRAENIAGASGIDTGITRFLAVDITMLVIEKMTSKAQKSTIRGWKVRRSNTSSFTSPIPIFAMDSKQANIRINPTYLGDGNPCIIQDMQRQPARIFR